MKNSVLLIAAALLTVAVMGNCAMAQSDCVMSWHEMRRHVAGWSPTRYHPPEEFYGDTIPCVQYISWVINTASTPTVPMSNMLRDLPKEWDGHSAKPAYSRAAIESVSASFLIHQKTMDSLALRAIYLDVSHLAKNKMGLYSNLVSFDIFVSDSTSTEFRLPKDLDLMDLILNPRVLYIEWWVFQPDPNTSGVYVWDPGAMRVYMWNRADGIVLWNCTLTY